MLNETQITYGRTITVPGARTLFARAVAALVTWDAAFRQAKRLSELDDHLLDDIGVTREQARRYDAGQDRLHRAG